MTMPRQYQDLIEGKMSSCWKNCGIDEVEDNSFLKLKSSTTVGGRIAFERLQLQKHLFQPVGQ